MSLARGLSVLQAFTAGRSELSLSEMAEIAGVTNPSALRIGHTLVELGFLTRNPRTKGYRVGPAVLTLGMASLSSMSLLDIAEPYLFEFRDEIEETVKLAVLHGLEMVYIGRYPSLIHPDGGAPYVGSRLPAAQTCTGRAILAQLDESEMHRIVSSSELRQFTPLTVTDADRIVEEIHATRERGYSLNDQGTSLERRSAAVALLPAPGRPVGAINISVSAQRVSLDELKKSYVPRLQDVAKRINGVLPSDLQNAGFRPTD